jgi:hypothetical protein
MNICFHFSRRRISGMAQLDWECINQSLNRKKKNTQDKFLDHNLIQEYWTRWSFLEIKDESMTKVIGPKVENAPFNKEFHIVRTGY